MLAMLDSCKTTGALVCTLLFWSSPSAIFRLVVAIIIDPLKSHTFWAYSHIREKIFKAVLPPLANGNAPRTIDFPFAAFWAKAAIFHRGPTPVCGGSFFTLSSKSVDERSARTATFFACVKIPARLQLFRATGAAAYPNLIAVPVDVRDSQHGPSSEYSSSKIDFSRHIALIAKVAQ